MSGPPIFEISAFIEIVILAEDINKSERGNQLVLWMLVILWCEHLTIRKNHYDQDSDVRFRGSRCMIQKYNINENLRMNGH